ncbi:MAG: glycosyltransferase family 4 protein [Rikenellaceae bacterium]
MKKIIRTSTVPVSLKGLLKGQLRMLSKHYTVVGVSSCGEALEQLVAQEGVEVRAINMERKISIFKDIKSLFCMIALLRKERPDIVHSITPKAGLITMLAAKIVGVPVRVHTFTGLIFPTARGFKQKLLIAMDRLLCRCATNIYPEGSGVKKALVDYKITSKPLKVIANGNVNGIDVGYFDPTNFEKNEDDIFRFVFIGRMVGDKGINELADAFMRLNAKYPQTELVLVGNFEHELDPLKPETKNIIDTHKAINFVGYQSDVRPFLAASDAFVFPSYREGFPNVVMQAGAMGLPQIVTDINGCNEIIIEGKNGVIIPPQDANALYDTMEIFIASPDEVANMARTAREMIISRYEQSLVWEAILEEYKLLLGE